MVLLYVYFIQKKSLYNFRQQNEILSSSFELVHGAVEAEHGAEVEEAPGGQDGLQGDEEGGPPGQDQDLLVQPDGLDRLLSHEFRVEDGQDPGLDPGEHSGVDVVGADHGRVDVLGVASDRELDPVIRYFL